MAADPTQGPAALDASQETPPEDPTQSQGAPEAPSGSGVDVVAEVERAIAAGAKLAKAFATGRDGDFTGIDPSAYQAAMTGINQGLQGLAKYNPPTPPLDPNQVQKDRTDSAKAVLQDQQHSDQMDVQLETAKQREGRPPGPAKP